VAREVILSPPFESKRISLAALVPSVVFLNPAEQPDEHQKAMQAPAKPANTHNRLISRVNTPEKEGKKD